MVGIVNGDFEMDEHGAQPTGWTVSIIADPAHPYYTEVAVTGYVAHSGTKSCYLYNDAQRFLRHLSNRALI